MHAYIQAYINACTYTCAPANAWVSAYVICVLAYNMFMRRIFSSWYQFMVSFQLNARMKLQYVSWTEAYGQVVAISAAMPTITFSHKNNQNSSPVCCLIEFLARKDRKSWGCRRSLARLDILESSHGSCIASWACRRPLPGHART